MIDLQSLDTELRVLDSEARNLGLPHAHRAIINELRQKVLPTMQLKRERNAR